MDTYLQSIVAIGEELEAIDDLVFDEDLSLFALNGLLADYAMFITASNFEPNCIYMSNVFRSSTPCPPLKWPLLSITEAETTVLDAEAKGADCLE